MTATDGGTADGRVQVGGRAGSAAGIDHAVMAGLRTRPALRTLDPGALEDAVWVLEQGERIAILVDQSARGAAGRVVELAEVLGAGIAKTPLGRSVLPDSLPFVTGCIGLLGTHASDVMLSSCDTLLRIGTLFPCAAWLPSGDRARLVEIDTDPCLAGSDGGADVRLVGDADRALRALLSMVGRKSDRSWRRRIEQEVAAGRARGEIRPLPRRGGGLGAGTLSARPPQITPGPQDGGRAIEPAALWRQMARMVPGPHRSTQAGSIRRSLWGGDRTAGWPQCGPSDAT